MNQRNRLTAVATKRQMNLLKNPVWRAYARQPMAQTQQVDLALAAHAAFDEITQGRGTDSHVDTIAMACNVALMLAERGFGPECEPKIIEAQLAVMRIKARQMQGKAIGMDGPGAQALRDMLATQVQQIEQAGQVEVGDAVLEVRARMLRGDVMEVAL